MSNEEQQPITIDAQTADVLAQAFSVAARNMDYLNPQHAAAIRIGQAFIDMLRERANGKN
jgi:hypothetical protein